MKPFAKAAVVLLLVSGCAGESVQPVRPLVDFNSGYFETTWIITDPCSEEPCFASLVISYDAVTKNPPLMTIKRESDQVFELTLEELWLLHNAVESAIYSSTRRHGGCADGIPIEKFYSFAGDNFIAAEIQGCDSEAINAARNALRAVALKYLGGSETMGTRPGDAMR